MQCEHGYTRKRREDWYGTAVLTQPTYHFYEEIAMAPQFFT